MFYNIKSAAVSHDGQTSTLNVKAGSAGLRGTARFPFSSGSCVVHQALVTCKEKNQGKEIKVREAERF